MVEPGRKFVKGSSKYRYSINGQEKETELNENTTTAEYWEYDSRIRRRWNVDPIIKKYESPYSCFGNSPIRVVDKNGKDSIFYSQKGKELNRVKMKGHHTYFLEHKDGNRFSNSKSYFQGNSYYSFFGDPDRFNKPTLFKDIDRKTISNSMKETIDALINQVYDGEGYTDIFLRVATGDKKFDYKNGILFNKNYKNKDEIPSNLYTAYLIDGILHNRNEAGIILWGATLAKTNVGYTGIYIDNQAAHYATEYNSDELHEMNMWRMGWLTMKNANDVDKYKNTFMYGVFGIHFDKETQGWIRLIKMGFITITGMIYAKNKI
jgi:hypothetical protein